MKKSEKNHPGSPRKLGLDRETLRRLEPAELHGVQTGLMPDVTSGCCSRITTKP